MRTSNFIGAVYLLSLCYLPVAQAAVIGFPTSGPSVDITAGIEIPQFGFSGPGTNKGGEFSVGYEIDFSTGDIIGVSQVEMDIGYILDVDPLMAGPDGSVGFYQRTKVSASGRSTPGQRVFIDLSARQTFEVVGTAGIWLRSSSDIDLVVTDLDTGQLVDLSLTDGPFSVLKTGRYRASIDYLIEATIDNGVDRSWTLFFKDEASIPEPASLGLITFAFGLLVAKRYSCS